MTARSVKIYSYREDLEILDFFSLYVYNVPSIPAALVVLTDVQDDIGSRSRRGQNEECVRRQAGQGKEEEKAICLK